MKTKWNNTPGSRQHWLYGGGIGGRAFGGRILGMVYEVSPTAFTVYREMPQSSRDISRREFLAEMPTLDEAKDLLMTIIGSQT